jgi:hypothetical protein
VNFFNRCAPVTHSNIVGKLFARIDQLHSQKSSKLLGMSVFPVRVQDAIGGVHLLFFVNRPSADH